MWNFASIYLKATCEVVSCALDSGREDEIKAAAELYHGAAALLCDRLAFTWKHLCTDEGRLDLSAFLNFEPDFDDRVRSLRTIICPLRLYPGLEIAVWGLVFLAQKVAFSWQSVDRFGKKFWGLMILGQVKSVQNFCLFGPQGSEKRNFWREKSLTLTLRFPSLEITV